MKIVDDVTKLPADQKVSPWSSYHYLRWPKNMFHVLFTGKKFQLGKFISEEGWVRPMLKLIKEGKVDGQVNVGLGERRKTLADCVTWAIE